MSPEDRKRAEAAREALAGVERDATGAFGSAMKRASDHFSARDVEREGLARDWAEVWGRRIGRALAAVFFVVLLLNLFTGWFF
ncbi:MAG: hypothetical protein IPL88_02875 [Rhizobiales bacterium]|nr:hypothetical protein [Hyphomicrobiales bacterium]